jgi:hypothetical protein
MCLTVFCLYFMILYNTKGMSHLKVKKIALITVLHITLLYHLLITLAVRMFAFCATSIDISVHSFFHLHVLGRKNFTYGNNIRHYAYLTIYVLHSSLLLCLMTKYSCESLLYFQTPSLVLL